MTSRGRKGRADDELRIISEAEESSLEHSMLGCICSLLVGINRLMRTMIFNDLVTVWYLCHPAAENLAAARSNVSFACSCAMRALYLSF